MTVCFYDHVLCHALRDGILRHTCVSMFERCFTNIAIFDFILFLLQRSLLVSGEVHNGAQYLRATRVCAAAVLRRGWCVSTKLAVIVAVPVLVAVIVHGSISASKEFHITLASTDLQTIIHRCECTC